MKKLVCVLVVALVLSGQLFAQVKKQSKSRVTFKGIGAYATEDTVQISGEKKRTDSKTDFKGKGILGKMAGKLFLKSGVSGEIIDLPAMTIYSMDHKKKQYTERAIEKIELPDPDPSQDVSDVEAETEEAEQRESDIEIIKSEFRVEDTGETKSINGFDCKRYKLLAYTQWRHKQTGETGTDSLATDVWTTPYSNDLQQAQEQEMAFAQSYMQAIGMDTAVEGMTRDLLGAGWLEMFAKIKKDEVAAGPDYEKFAEESGKIEGYPVLIDGNYFAIRPQSQQTQEQTEEETDVTDVRKNIGGLAKGLFGKKKKAEEPKGPQPIFSYYTEVLGVEAGNLEETAFAVPEKYKKK